eukprot:1446834-Pleurochrysis_carterae.AAC.1
MTKLRYFREKANRSEGITEGARQEEAGRGGKKQGWSASLVARFYDTSDWQASLGAARSGFQKRTSRLQYDSERSRCSACSQSSSARSRICSTANMHDQTASSQHLALDDAVSASMKSKIRQLQSSRTQNRHDPEKL